jgi:flagellar basal-body rod protein FlgB
VARCFKDPSDVIDGVTNSDSLPVLERMLQFAGQRHRIIAHNIANISTPDFRPVDVSVQSFQDQLGEAVDERRARFGSSRGNLHLRSTPEVEVSGDGLSLNPTPIGANLLFHDGNDRDLERTMQSMVENFMTFRFAAEALRSRYDLLNVAIRERV